MLILYSIACYMSILTRMLVSNPHNPLLYFYCLDHHSQPCIVDCPNKTCYRLGNKRGFLIIVVLEFESGMNIISIVIYSELCFRDMNS